MTAPIEVSLTLPGGRELRLPAAPEPCSYLRVVSGEKELLRWNARDWEEDSGNFKQNLLAYLRLTVF